MPGVDLLNASRIQYLEDFVGNVMLWMDVNRLLKNQVIFFSFRHLLDHLVGALKHLLQLFIFPGIEIFLKLTALALKVTILVHQLLLTRGTLALRQGRRFTLESNFEAPIENVEVKWAAKVKTIAPR